MAEGVFVAQDVIIALQRVNANSLHAFHAERRNLNVVDEDEVATRAGQRADAAHVHLDPVIARCSIYAEQPIGMTGACTFRVSRSRVRPVASFARSRRSLSRALHAIGARR